MANKVRNEPLFNKRDRAKETIYRSRDDTLEWLHHVESDQNDRRSTKPRRQTRWRKLEHGWMKCNFDASFNDQEDDMDLGWILRDSNGFLDRCGLVATT